MVISAPLGSPENPLMGVPLAKGRVWKILGSWPIADTSGTLSQTDQATSESQLRPPSPEDAVQTFLHTSDT
jgi:hypothetical protein